jgi:hypothetical protein
MNAETKQRIRNEKLFELLKDLANSFMNALDKPFFPDYGSWYSRAKALLQADPELVARILEMRPDLEEKKLSRCILSAQKSLKALQNESICRNYPHASTIEGYKEELALFLERLFNQRERSRARMQFTEEGFKRHFDRIFLEEYLRFEDYLYNSSASSFVVSPLQNFISSRNIEFENQVSIRKITQEEFHHLIEAEEADGYALESYPEFVLYVPVSDDEWQELLRRVITSMRLLKKSKVGLTRIYYASALPFRAWQLIEALEGTKFDEKSKDTFFTVDSGEEAELKRIFALLIRAKDVGYLVMSMRRFNLAYERERLEDSWIDFFVSLESLYSKASEITEVAHRLATRISRALTVESLEDRKQIRDEVKNWYNIRSRIVHGQKVELDHSQLEELEDTLRKSLVWFLGHNDYANHDRIIDLLDLG